MVARKLVVVVASLAFAVLASACANGGNPNTPSPANPAPVAASVAPILPPTLSNGQRLVANTYVDPNGGFSFDVQYAVPAEAFNQGNVGVSACPASTFVEKACYIMARDNMRVFQSTGVVTMHISFAKVEPSLRPAYTDKYYVYVYNMTRKDSASAEDTPPGSGAHDFLDLFNVYDTKVVEIKTLWTQ